jgi:hypothetical protein
MALSVIFAVAGLAATGVGTYLQYKGAKDQAKAVKKENALRRQAADLSSRRQRRQAWRETLRRTAASQAQQANQGALGSSPGYGATAAIGSNFARTGLNLSQNTEIGAGINAAQGQQADAGTMMSLGGGLRSLGSSIYGASDTLGRLGSYASGGRLRA